MPFPSPLPSTEKSPEGESEDQSEDEDDEEEEEEEEEVGGYYNLRKRQPVIYHFQPVHHVSPTICRPPSSFTYQLFAGCGGRHTSQEEAWPERAVPLHLPLQGQSGRPEGLPVQSGRSWVGSIPQEEAGPPRLFLNLLWYENIVHSIICSEDYSGTTKCGHFWDLF